MTDDITPAMRKNEGKPFGDDELAQMRELSGENAPVKVVALRLGRPPEEVRQKAKDEGIELHDAD